MKTIAIVGMLMTLGARPLGVHVVRVVAGAVRAGLLLAMAVAAQDDGTVYGQSEEA